MTGNNKSDTASFPSNNKSDTMNSACKGNSNNKSDTMNLGNDNKSDTLCLCAKILVTGSAKGLVISGNFDEEGRF